MKSHTGRRNPQNSNRKQDICCPFLLYPSIYLFEVCIRLLLLYDNLLLEMGFHVSQLFARCSSCCNDCCYDSNLRVLNVSCFFSFRVKTGSVREVRSCRYEPTTVSVHQLLIGASFQRFRQVVFTFRDMWPL